MTLSTVTGLCLLPPVWPSLFLACFRASGVSGYLERHSQWEWASVPDQRLPLKRRSVSALKSYWFIVKYQLNLFIIDMSLWLESFFFYFGKFTPSHFCVELAHPSLSSPLTVLLWYLNEYLCSSDTSITPEWWNQSSYTCLFSPSACMLVSGHLIITPPSLSVGRLLLLCL